MAHVFFAVDASRDLFDAAAKMFGHRRGGLAYASIAGCGGFGAINGSSLATAATVGLVALPEMRRRGYSDTLATGTVAAGGTLGQMIPPSGALIVFGIIAETSIGGLFTAAIIPGITQALFYFAVIWLLVRLRPGLAPAGDRRQLERTFACAGPDLGNRPADRCGHRRYRAGLDQPIRGRSDRRRGCIADRCGTPPAQSGDVAGSLRRNAARPAGCCS